MTSSISQESTCVKPILICGLRVAGRTSGARFDNDALGIARLLASLANAHLDGPHLVVIEPTGRSHPALWRALDEAGHGAAPINPHAARRLAEGLGRLAKTAAIYAATLCGIAQRFPPAVRPAPDDITMAIKALYAARASAIKRRAMVRTQDTASDNALVHSLLATGQAGLTTRIKALTAALNARFTAKAETRRTREILMSIPGIGEGAAIAILTELTEIGQASRAEIAALTGTAPMTRQSGTWNGRARTRARTCGERRCLRAALYMPAIVAMTRNPELRAFADRLRGLSRISAGAALRGVFVRTCHPCCPLNAFLTIRSSSE